MGWKTDWLYQCIFQEIKILWDRAQQEATKRPDLMGIAPEFLRIQQCET